MWMSLYAAVALVAAIAVFLLAEWLRMPGVSGSDNPGRYAVVAGLLWPVMVLGIAQWGLIAMVAARLGRSASCYSAPYKRAVRATEQTRSRGSERVNSEAGGQAQTATLAATVSD